MQKRQIAFFRQENYNIDRRLMKNFRPERGQERGQLARNVCEANNIF